MLFDFDLHTISIQTGEKITTLFNFLLIVWYPFYALLLFQRPSYSTFFN